MGVKDITGMRFGRLTVIKRADDYLCGKNRLTQWLCKCDCGECKTVLANSLSRGKTRSCGCYRKEYVARKNITHKQSHTRLYAEWRNMINRCKFNTHYKNNKIDICDEWANNFVSFYEWSIINGYSDDLTLDRVDNDRGYSPNNCRWVSTIIQQNNKGNNHYIEHCGEKHTISEWGRITGYGDKVIRRRLCLGWNPEKALTTPVRGRRKNNG